MENNEVASSNGREEANKAAEEFLTAVPVLDEVSRKVSREGLRRVFKALVTFPYVSEDIERFNSDYERDLFTICMRMQELKTTMNVIMDDQLEKMSEELKQEANKLKEASNGEVE